MGGEPTVLGMINESLTEIKCDVKEIKDDLKNGAVKLENHEQRILNVEGKTTLNEKITVEHIRNKEKHYNPHYSETFRQRVWRKRGEIGVATGGSIGIGSLLFALLKFGLELI